MDLDIVAEQLYPSFSHYTKSSEGIMATRIRHPAYGGGIWLYTYLLVATVAFCSVGSTLAWTSSSRLPSLSPINNGNTRTHDDETKSSLFLSSTSLSLDLVNHNNDDNTPDDANSFLLQAAAAVTQQSCELLGVKSVGVDYGLAKTGIAATVGYDPKPLAILAVQKNNTAKLCQDIIQICQSQQAAQIIVGLPLHKNGTEAEQTTLTRVFGRALTKLTRQQLGPHVPIYFWDERYTSKYAFALATSGDDANTGRLRSKDDLYGMLDADAACIILEHYYSKNGQGAHEIKLTKEEEAECLQVWQATQANNENKLQAATQERMGGRSTQRQQAMERARELEAQLQQTGALGDSRKKKKKKKKKKREKRGPWLSAGGEEIAA